jgi:hypothetical protein
LEEKHDKSYCLRNGPEEQKKFRNEIFAFLSDTLTKFLMCQFGTGAMDLEKGQRTSPDPVAHTPLLGW